jgi:predicted secreted protein
MSRLFLFLFFMMMALAAPALALERPRLDVLGFSPDGRFFAYRQSGR